MKQTNVDDLVIKVLGHSERREILRILESSPEGVKYSSILEDTGLSTSKLNYQLNELQEFIQKTMKASIISHHSEEKQ